MKRIFVCLILLGLYQTSMAQDESYQDHHRKQQDRDGDSIVGFDKKNLFVGGSLSLGYTSGYGSYYDASNGGYTTIPSSIFNIGVLPEIGYKFSKVLDAGLEGNINYYSTSSSQYTSYKNHDLAYGIGAFARISPIEAFFIQLMPELDWIKQTSINSGYTSKLTVKSSSFLAGVGYKYQSESDKSYFYAVLMIDLAKGYSPYKTYDQSGGLIPLPIVRLAYNYFPFR